MVTNKVSLFNYECHQLLFFGLFISFTVFLIPIGNADSTTQNSGPIPQILVNNSTYNQLISNLEKAGYSPGGGSMKMTLTEILIDEHYNTTEGKNTTISSVIRNGTVESVTVKKEDEAPLGWYIGIILLIILISLCCWAGYRYYQKQNIQPDEEPPVTVEPVDIRKVTEEYLTMAEAAIKDGRIKDAYVSSGQALRFLISHTRGSGSADTTEEILTLARKKGIDTGMISRILDRCMMVEYARSEGSSDEAIGFIGDIRSFVSENLPDE